MKTPAAGRLALLVATLAVTACSPSSVDPAARPRVEIRRAELTPAAGLAPITTRRGRTVYAHDAVELAGRDFAEASLGADNLGRPAVVITLTEEAGARLLAMTSAHLDRPLVILVDGEAVSAPVVVSPLSSAVMITGLPEDETRALIDGLNGR